MFIQPVDFARFQEALAWPAGWAEIGLTGFAIGLAWALGRRWGRARAARGDTIGATVGVAFPLLALLFLYAADWIYRRAFAEPFLLEIAIPLMAALAVIRALVYAMRRLFRGHDWLVPWERTIGAAVWILLALHYLGVLPEIAQTLDDIEIPIGKTHPTLLSLLTGIAVLLGSLIVTLWISGFIERRLDDTTHLDSSLRAILSRLIRAVLLVAGGLIALEAIGFDLTLFTVFGGAVGVGIGLGLQRLAANYVSGFTILLDRSVRLGDIITVEGKWRGTVSRVTARYVLVRQADGVEVIVPNETLVTTTVLNHSHAPAATPELRVAVQVPIAADADAEQALRLLEQAALEDARVLRDAAHAPKAFIAGFAETGINLELGVYVKDTQIDPLDLRSALHRAILRAFAAQGIGIAYPHRDVRVVQREEPPATPPPGDASPRLREPGPG
jgi:small-conductance mechanosensitive channel